MNRNTQTLTVASSEEELEEESDYVNTAVCTVSATSDKKCGSFTQCFLPVAVSWVILLVILVLHIYLSLYYHENNVRELEQLKENHTILLETNRNLTDLNDKLKRDKDNQTVIIGNLKQEYNVSEMKIVNLTEENKKITTDKQQMEKEKNILTEQIRNIEQIIAAYCPIRDEIRQCKPCPDGWLHHKSSCYVIHDPDKKDEQKTWEEAQQNCRGKKSDLAVIVNVDEKKFINDKSWKTSSFTGYWIGLRAEAGKWKWIDGSDLAEKSWMTQPANNGLCAISVPDPRWRSASCGNKNGWICKKATLSVETVRNHT